MPLCSQINLPFKENKSLPYDDVIQLYKQLDNDYENCKLIEAGITDVGRLLHLFILSDNNHFTPGEVKQSGKRIILIMNAIHPGESCGVDASLLFADDILRNVDGMGNLLENTVICIIPIYNIGGYLNRSPFYRTNQTGPEETGFRGNARNLDLNRDFIKADTRNARSFIQIFHEWDPDIFLDTHVTNGSDHQYAITLIATNYQKIDPSLGQFMNETFVPRLYNLMSTTPYELIPYVNYINQSPENGISGYDDVPRYSTGYASLFNTIGFMTENHAYKPFPDRVLSVYHFMVSLLRLTHEHNELIGQLRETAKANTRKQNEFSIIWEHDSTRFETLTFKGYERARRISPLTGQEVWYYDRDKPFEKEIPYYTYFKPSKTVTKPDYYIIPQAWEDVISRLILNDIQLSQFDQDTVLEVEAYYIDDLSISRRPYNGRFKHSDVMVRKEVQIIQFYSGDYLIPLNQEGNRYLVETLEPDAPDSFFGWNFFDPILDRREYFSRSGFDTIAIRLLDEDPVLREKYVRRVEKDTAFSEDHFAQLYFIYSNSPYAEKSYRRYPVYRFNGNLE